MFVYHLIISKHSEKVQFLLDYLEGKLASTPSGRPLLLIGKGSTGKTKVLNEVAEKTSVPFIHMNIENTFLLHCPEGAAVGKRSRPPIIFETLGDTDDMRLEEYFNATLVEFIADPDAAK